MAKFADLLRHSQTLRADKAASSTSTSTRTAKHVAVRNSSSGDDSDAASHVSSDGDTYSGSDGDSYSGSDGDGDSGEDEEGARGWGAQAQPAKAGREAKKRQLQQQQQQSHKLKQQKLNRGAGAASAFVSSLRGRSTDNDAVEEIDMGGGSDRKNRMGQRQVRRPRAC